MMMYSEMKNSLCFDKNSNVERALEATQVSLLKSWESRDLNISGFTCGFDQDTGDVLFFFPLEDLERLSKENREHLFNSLKHDWNTANFTILEEREGSGYEYFHVGFAHLFFRLQSCA